jgi:hypothetical protein
MPLSVQQQLHIPPASILQRFCTMLVAILSSQTQVSLKPPVHFSTLKVQRGTIRKFVPGVTAVGVPTVGVPYPGKPTCGTTELVRSIIIVLDINRTPFTGRQSPPDRP